MGVLFVVEGGVAVAIPDDYQSSKDHKKFLAEIQRPGLTYDEAVVCLEKFAKGRDRRGVAADLLPREDWARRFINQTALLLERSSTQKSGERGLRVLTALLMGHRRRMGRPKLETERHQIGMAVDNAHEHVHNNWHLIKNDERAEFGAVFKSKRVSKLLRKKYLRPSEVIYTLVSEKLGVSVRRVRNACQPIEMKNR